MVRDGSEEGVLRLLTEVPELVEVERYLYPLHVAAKYNHPNIVSILLDNGADFNAQDSLERRSALHFAVQTTDGKRSAAQRQLSHENNTQSQASATTSTMEVTTTELLLKQKNIDPNCQDVKGDTPLHYAARWSNEQAHMELLMNHPKINPNLQNYEGETPLHYTARWSNVGVCKLLLNDQRPHQRTDILVTGSNKNTSLHYAADKGCTEVTEVLLKAAERKGTESVKELLKAKNTNGDTALNIAVRRDFYDVTQLILNKGNDEIDVANKDGDTPLHNCKHTGIIVSLLGTFPNVLVQNKDGATPLHLAARDGRDLIMEQFENFSQDRRNDKDVGEIFNCTDNNRRTPLLIASQYGKDVIVSRLLKNKAVNPGARDINEKTALHLASENNHPNVIKVLRDGECPKLSFVDDPDGNGETPLHAAAEHGYLDVVKLLIQNGVNVQPCGRDSMTPLHLACQNGHDNVVRMLVTYESAAIHSKCGPRTKWATALQCAASYGHFEIVQYLIDHGAKLNAKNVDHDTALHTAAKKGKAKTCRILIDNGADVTITNKEKDTPLQAACAFGHIKVVEILLQHWITMMKNKAVSRGDWEDYITNRNMFGKNCLDRAIEFDHKEIAEMTIKTKKVMMLLLRNCYGVYNQVDPTMTSPMRQLIKHMPGVAETAFSKCITKIERSDPDDKRFEFNYTYLDDNDKRHTWTKDERVVVYDSDILFNPRVYKDIHVLTTLAKSERKELLFHPLVSALLLKKSWSRVMFIFYLHLALYLIFLGFLTAYMVSSIPPYQINATNFKLAGNGTLCEQVEAGGHRQSDIVTALQYLTLTFSAILLFSEVIQCYLKKMSYFTFDNMIELIIFSFAILVTIDFTTCSNATGFRYTWQWSMGTASLFFGWINLALYLQKFTYFGIYVLMFKHILKTFQKFIIVYVLFVIAFALAFYSEIRGLTPYQTFPLSFVKTVVMMTGEFDYGNDFVANDLHNTMAVYILFVCFMVVMTILVMNLLVGLAVGDIAEIQSKADVKRLQMQIDLVLDLEGVARALPCRKIRNILMGDKQLIQEIDLEKTSKLPFNLDKYVGMKPFGLTLEAVERALNTKKSDVQEEQQSDKLKERLKQQEEMLKEQANKLKSIDETMTERLAEMQKEQTNKFKSLDETLKLVLEKLPKPQQ